MVTTRVGQELFSIFVNDEQMIRLALDEPVLQCGHQVFKTNFLLLHVMEALSEYCVSGIDQ